MKVIDWKNEILEEEIARNNTAFIEYYNKMVDEYLNKFDIDNVNCCKFYIKTNGEFKINFYKIIFNIIKDWEELSMSPYSYSIYNKSNIEWNSKPEGSFRISDHWNFISNGEKHCIMEDETLNNKWLLCQYKDGIYHVVMNITREFIKNEQ